MCDTIVAVPPATADGCVLFGKNSDREPGEAQVVEHRLAQTYSSPDTLRCTYLQIPQAHQTYEVALSRPFWMWGAEMGANEHGVAIGNEAVWTRLPVAETGLTGMDLVRLGLERACSAREALTLITGWLQEFGQGGHCGYRKKRFCYHNSFLIADPYEAWVLETAGPHWVAEKVRGVRTISNALTIGRDFDLLSEGAYPYARSRGWCKSAADFNFASAFGDTIYRLASGAELRRACTQHNLQQNIARLDLPHFIASLRDHNGSSPEAGWRMEMPCSHASWQPSRQAGQTTGSLVSRLHPKASTHWFTGTSAPCLSVFKPLLFGKGPIDTGPEPGGKYDGECLFWRHEWLHRLTLQDFTTRHALIEQSRKHLELTFLQMDHSEGNAACQQAWAQHREVLPEWVEVVDKIICRDTRSRMAKRYWDRQNMLDDFPLNTH